MTGWVRVSTTNRMTAWTPRDVRLIAQFLGVPVAQVRGFTSLSALEQARRLDVGDPVAGWVFGRTVSPFESTLCEVAGYIE